MDTAVLDTLPARELACGFAEVVKYGLLAGPALFERVEAWPTLPGEQEALVDLIGDCIDQKIAVVQGDEHDLGQRAILNLGHTVGHGIEAAGGYGRYHHGEAISLGLLAAMRLSGDLLDLDASWRERTREILARHGLPVQLDPSISLDDVLEAIGRDKKAAAGALNMVLLSAPGEPHTRQNPTHAQVVAAIRELTS
jgi:3-dehydroquinate synthase